ncbi:MAG: porin [Rubrivivax sp.]
MKIRHIAPALMLAMPAAWAQSVAIYGVADAALESVKTTGAAGGPSADRQRLSRLTSEGSFLGIRGSEDLGDGLAAVFQLEGNFSIDTGDFTSWNRDTFVGLRSTRWGSGTLGQNTTPMRSLGNSLDLTPGANTGIGAIQSLLSINRQSSGADNRRPNSVRYRSPTFSNLSLDLVYGLGESRDAATGRNDTMIGLGFSYRAGPWFVGYAYDRQNDSNRAGLAQTQGKDTRHRVGAKYNVLPQLMVGGFYDTAASSGTFGAGTGKITKDTWGVIGQWDVGAHGVYAMLVQARPVECSGVTTGNGVGCATAADTGARLLTLGYTYDLSKRTMIRAAVSRITNESAARYDFSNGSIGANAGADPVGISIGLRHRF